MAPGSILIFLLVPLTLVIQMSSYGAADTYELQSKNCSTSSGNLTTSGLYQMNLRQFLATLPSNVISNKGYFNGSMGSVYGMAMCQADMPWPDHCESCLQAASAGAPEACPSSNNASVAYRGCVLRYWDTPVRADTLDDVFNTYVAYYAQDQAGNVPADNSSVFQKTREDLFKDLSSTVLTSPLRIATGNRTFNDTHSLYGLAQCNRDLSNEWCSEYILEVASLVPDLAPDVQWSEGASFIGYTYYLRYDLRPFQVYMPGNGSGPLPETTKDAAVQYKVCSSPGNSSSSSDPYQANLHQFLTALPSKVISNSGFFNGTTGSDQNTVFGVAMCQADVTWPDQCKSCLQSASAGAPTACPSSNDASVAYRGCVLRYSNTPILAADKASDDSVAFYTQNHAASVPNTTAFQQTRKDLLADLTGAAVISPSMIASGNRVFNSTHKLYGLAQCNKDLPSELCSQYITSVVIKLAPDVQWSEGMSITGFNVYIRYDLTPFQVYMPGNGAKGEGGSTHRGIVAIVAIAVAISIILLMLVMFMLVRHYQQKRKNAKIQKLTGLTEFSYREIKNGTMNFKEENKLGEGGFGQVYKGRLRLSDGDEKEVAVKRVTNNDTAKQLMDELETLAKLRHKNVVRLVGFCIKGKKLFVCNEMLSNGSLDTHLHGAAGQARLAWSTRYEIIRGVCDGLHYLHGACNNTIWHMDIKPNNILLDEQLKPKIADFGLSKVFENKNKNNTMTMNVVGKRGYMAPEFVKYGRVGCEYDIFSLGILIMVVVIGKGPDGNELSGTTFINEIRQKLDTSNPQELMKYACLDVCDSLDAVKTCLALALDCVKEKPEDRPTTKDICARLHIGASDSTHVEVEVK